MGNYIEIPLELYRDIYCYFNSSLKVHKSYTNIYESTLITEWGFAKNTNPLLRYEKINDKEKFYLYSE